MAERKFRRFRLRLGLSPYRQPFAYVMRKDFVPDHAKVQENPKKNPKRSRLRLTRSQPPIARNFQQASTTAPFDSRC